MNIISDKIILVIVLVPVEIIKMNAENLGQACHWRLVSWLYRPLILPSCRLYIFLESEAKDGLRLAFFVLTKKRTKITISIFINFWIGHSLYPAENKTALLTPLVFMGAIIFSTTCLVKGQLFKIWSRVSGWGFVWPLSRQKVQNGDTSCHLDRYN